MIGGGGLRHLFESSAQIDSWILFLCSFPLLLSEPPPPLHASPFLLFNLPDRTKLHFPYSPLPVFLLLDIWPFLALIFSLFADYPFPIFCVFERCNPLLWVFEDRASGSLSSFPTLLPTSGIPQGLLSDKSFPVFSIPCPPFVSLQSCDFGLFLISLDHLPLLLAPFFFPFTPFPLTGS